jgi:hypothetical protein
MKIYMMVCKLGALHERKTGQSLILNDEFMRIPPKEIPPKLHFLVNVILVVNIFIECDHVSDFVNMRFPFHDAIETIALIKAFATIWGSSLIIMGRIHGTIILGLTFVIGGIGYLLFDDRHAIWHHTLILSVQTLGTSLLLFCKKNDVSGWRVLIDNQKSD